MQQRLRNRTLGVILTLATVIGLTVTVYAQAIQQKIEFYLDAKVGTELLKKGNYTILFPDAEQGTLEIKVGKKGIGVPFTRRPIPLESEADRITYRANDDGTRSISTITPRGRKFTLVLQ